MIGKTTQNKRDSSLNIIHTSHPTKDCKLKITQLLGSKYSQISTQKLPRKVKDRGLHRKKPGVLGCVLEWNERKDKLYGWWFFSARSDIPPDVRLCCTTISFVFACIEVQFAQADVVRRSENPSYTVYLAHCAGKDDEGGRLEKNREWLKWITWGRKNM